MELKGKIINFLGDSITQGCGTSGGEVIFTERIAAMCELKRANNYGIGGTRFARQKKPSDPIIFDEDFCKRCVDMDKEADINVVFGGTNDFGHGDAPIGTFEDRTPDTFYGACHYLMKTMIETYPDAVTVIVTPLHRMNEDSLRGDNKPEDVGNLKTYVEIIKEVAEYYALPILDLYAMSGLQPHVWAIQSRLMPDGLHPNDAGHKVLADRMVGFLKAL